MLRRELRRRVTSSAELHKELMNEQLYNIIIMLSIFILKLRLVHSSVPAIPNLQHIKRKGISVNWNASGFSSPFQSTHSCLYLIPKINTFNIRACFLQGLPNTSFVMLMEMMPSKIRTHFAGLYEISWPIGSVLMASISWAVKDWRKIQLAFSLISIYAVVYFW